MLIDYCAELQHISQQLTSLNAFPFPLKQAVIPDEPSVEIARGRNSEVDLQVSQPTMEFQDLSFPPVVEAFPQASMS